LEGAKKVLTKKSSDPDIMIKSQMSDYEILGVLGEGAYGKVFHVVKKSDGTQLALKTIRKD
jgi:serine/threonine protein kinase